MSTPLSSSSMTPLLPFHLYAPKGVVTLITDQLDSSADFLLCRSLVSTLKSDATCILVSTSNDLNHWSAIASRSNLNLRSCIASEKFVFIDGASIVSGAFNPNEDANSSKPAPLKSIYSKISDAINLIEPSTVTERETPTLLLDDFSSLEWIGISQVDIQRFYRAVLALCRKHQLSVVILHHSITPDAPTPILQNLIHAAYSIIDVVPFASGRSGAVSGEIISRPGPLSVFDSSRPKANSSSTKASILQYRLTESGAVFFHKGSAAAII